MALVLTLLCGAHAHARQQPGEVIYFVLTDRFDDGNAGNNFAGLSPSAVSQHGFNRSNGLYYHGGDFKGLTNRMDYLSGLGVTALWITPPFRNQWVQQGSAAYHGYWILDFLSVDPHLGTDQEFRDFIAAAHARGIKVILDIVVNHTADVIYYRENLYSYRSKAAFPYRDAAGVTFDDRDFVYDGVSGFFPALSPQTSFPYRPVISSQLANARNPAWLNDVRNYHNRGNSNFQSEDSLYGDFVGLDDVFTEKPEVVEGMVDIFAYWINEYGIDGFRIDTVKHVNVEFWQVFTERMRAVADARGIGHFFMFGEVFDHDARMLSEYTTWAGLDGVLDFGFMGAVRSFIINGGSSAQLAAFFDNDPLYADTGRDARLLPVFVSNHDGGVERFGHYLRRDRPGLSDALQVKFVAQAHAFMFFARGQPVIYYGDEQGFAGGGGDWLAREDMMASAVPAYNNFDLIGTDARTNVANFDTAHPLYRAIAEMSAIYRAPEHEALRSGHQITRATGDAAVFAVSRFDPRSGSEYLFVAGNHASGIRTVNIPVDQAAGVAWTRLGGDAAVDDSSTAGTVRVSVPAAGWGVFQGGIVPSQAAPSIRFVDVVDGGVLPLAPHERSGVVFPGRARIEARVSGTPPLGVDFEVNDGAGWRAFATDVGPPHAAHFRPEADDPARTYAFRATVRDREGRSASAVIQNVRVASGASSEYFVVHFRDPSGVYPDPATAGAWGVEVSGEGLGAAAGFFPFTGATPLGRFAAVRLDDGAVPVNLKVRRRDGSESLTADFHSVVPARNAEVWTVAGEPQLFYDPISAEGRMTVHLKVPRAGDWRLRIAAGVEAPGELVIDSLASATSDGFGRVFHVPHALLAPAIRARQSLWLSVIEPEGTPDDGAVRSIRLPHASSHFWLEAGKPWVAFSEAEARGVVIIHYNRTAGDYGNLSSGNEFWGLHLWEGAATPTQWTAPLKPVRTDGFGLVFEVPLAANATRLAYIIHRGDQKDPGPDQFLSFDMNGFEVWQMQGAPVEAPYALHSGDRVLADGPSMESALSSLDPSLDLAGSFSFFAAAGRTYTVQRSMDLANWGAVVAPIPGSDTVESVAVDTGAPAFFRVIVE